MSYVFFDASKDRKFDDGSGGEVSLVEHLEYLKHEGGDPDCWGSTSTDRRARAMDEAKESGLPLYVVDELSWRVVGHVNTAA